LTSNEFLITSDSFYAILCMIFRTLFNFQCPFLALCHTFRLFQSPSAATAFLSYHRFFSLSSTFSTFFELFLCLLFLRRRIYILAQLLSNVKHQFLLSVCPCAFRSKQLLYSTTGYTLLSTPIFIFLYDKRHSPFRGKCRSCLYITDSVNKTAARLYLTFNTTYEEPSIILSFTLNSTFSIGYLLTRASSARAA